LRALFDATVAADFAHADLDRLCRFVDSVEDAIDALIASPVPIRPDAPARLL
jgi:hypothetical protein